MHKLNTRLPESARDAVTVTYGPHTLPAAVAASAETGTITDTRARFGIPRSTLYRLASAGHVRMLKLGRTTLVDFASVRAFLASAPAATLRSSNHLNETTPRG